MLGITSSAMLPLSGNSYPGINTTSYGYLNSNGDRYNNSAGTNIGFATYTAGDVIRFELDMDAGSCAIYKNNALQGTTFITGLTGTWFPAVAVYDSASDVVDVGFGQAALNASATFDAASGGYFVDTPNSGFKALCTQNLPAGTVTTSGSFAGNLATDGPFVFLNGVPTAMTINGNAVTFGTHADKLANGFKVRSSSSSYNASGSNTYSVSTTGEVFKNEVAQPNP
jgi:hypothetical protein